MLESLAAWPASVVLYDRSTLAHAYPNAIKVLLYKYNTPKILYSTKADHRNRSSDLPSFRLVTKNHAQLAQHITNPIQA